jgi:divalent metal cation (Fe/Co/Zn/Cd) transporter
LAGLVALVGLLTVLVFGWLVPDSWAGSVVHCLLPWTGR